MTTIAAAAAALRARKVSSRELTAESLRLIEKHNPGLNAFLTVTAGPALAAAESMDRELDAGRDRGPLHGIPIALKDVFCTKGVRTTCGSLLFKDYVPDFDCAVAERLQHAGAIMIGKTHMHELAYGVTSNNPHFGPVRNPWSLDRVPGGSSGGSGAAVAAGLVFMAMGSDTGGSIRIPAAFCGTVGLKPTSGRVSRHGVLPLDFSLDHMGPLTRNVEDAAICLQALAGRDERDETSSFAPVHDYRPGSENSPGAFRIGVPSNFYFDRVDPEARASVRRAIDAIADRGFPVEPVSVPDISELNAIGRVILLSEASACMRKFAGRRAEFGSDVRTLLDQGELLPATWYINAQRARRQYRDAFLAIFKSVDVLVTASTPTAAQKIGEAMVRIDGVEEDFRLATTRFARGINVLGFPAISIPSGLDADGMPVGLQLIGRPFEEKLLLNVAAEFERQTGWNQRTPPGF